MVNDGNNDSSGILDATDVYKTLKNIGVCCSCCTRFINGLKTEEKSTDNISGVTEEDKEVDGVCCVCLGLLKSSVKDEIISEACNTIKSCDFDCETYMLALSLPMTCFLREHSVKIFLNSKYNDGKDLYSDSAYISLKDAYRTCISSAISETVNKSISNIAEWLVTVKLCYEKDEGECSALHRIMKRKRKKNSQITHKDVIDYIDITDSELFRSLFSVPPVVPSIGVKFSGLTIQRESIFCAGRYNKWSRTLPQTPWIIDNERKVENSVQELIAEKLITAFGASNYAFSSSGREDVDVRALGRGRPFVLELKDCKKSTLSKHELRQVEKDINGVAGELIFVRDLQVVDRRDLKYLKQGEEEKRKEYCAICIVYGDIPNNLQEKFNSIVPLTLQQKTPVRVLHRRPVAIRPKKIYEIKVETIDIASEKGYKFLKLFVTTQAGTYVKEFVHGDLGRTVPCLSDILGVDTDIMALDVMNIELNWPPAIDYTL